MHSPLLYTDHYGFAEELFFNLKDVTPVWSVFLLSDKLVIVIPSPVS